MAAPKDPYPWQTWDQDLAAFRRRVEEAVRSMKHSQNIHKAATQLHRDALKFNRAVNVRGE